MWGALIASLLFAQVGKPQQIETNVDIGAAALRYADTVSTGTVSISPHFYADWRTGSFDATAAYSQFTSGGASVQGEIAASRFVSIGPRLAAEVGAFAGGSSHNDGTRTGEMVANARVHFTLARGELFAGAGGGRACYAGSCPLLVLGELGANLAAGPGSAQVTVSPAMVSDSIRYADAQASFSWSRDRLEVNALVGHRFGDQLTSVTADARSWGSLSATQWLAPRIALVASGGTYPIDPTQGFPGGRFISLSVRIKTGMVGRSAPATRGAPESLPHVVSTAAVSDFSARNDVGKGVTLVAVVSGATAQTVEIAGDFSSWEPLRLQQDSGRPGSWTIALPIQRGKYQLNIRVNGGPWRVPPGLLSMSDEFGGTVGLLVVE